MTVSATEDVNLEVFRRYAGLSLPRHVSYPMPTWWYDFSEEDVASMHSRSSAREGAADLSLYLHIPFCEALCKFCACNKVIQRKDAQGAGERIERYLAALELEITRLGGSPREGRLLRQIHWGGGSPTYLDSDAVAHVHETIQTAFNVAPDAEVSIEIDPRKAGPEKLRDLHRIGFNRVSMGIQDFDAKVQKHVRRVQPFEMVRDTVAVCREVGFDSVNFDLIYGLPYQNSESIRDTLERTIELSPDRIAYYHYAQIPDKIATQRGMDYTKLPDSESKLEMFLLGTQLFSDAGYEFIGLDHFAKPNELLAEAGKNGKLQRNFQGMTTGGGLDLIGAGASSISHLVNIGFMQNQRDIETYVSCIDDKKSSVHRGKQFTTDDLIRQAVLNQLYCRTEIHPQTIAESFGINFAEYFARELETLEELQRDGLVLIDVDGVIRATYPLGRVLLRNTAAVFDAYLEPDAHRVGDQNCYSANA